ncbi:uncharacterized protein PITG_22984 [Phytophthora infestans T30-4]|uniref:Uncharacterized protein n=1 Tax=Phytophthora infestans (strain T30-4) TaxID=403677 RepID=D0NLB0_PHYIT|nr:uncharacterized protein PITG_22984 [Phytophthora infestans T30-4]EEY60428.1 hypothetical protein PITG_22984 [Phytophthora infestans T30-4]|eukprot:XP_002900224.1 hypothetical protein PITG_22984 [Phytophthora infestans T30-4]
MIRQLWCELCKDGWKPRKPTGMAKDHRYVRPGVQGRLDESRRGIDYYEGEYCALMQRLHKGYQCFVLTGEAELMVFARRSGWLESSVPRVGITVSAPMGKLAAYAVAGRQVPYLDDSKPTTSSSVGLGQAPAFGDRICEPVSHRPALNRLEKS